jgi:hypothetical protein
MRKIAGLGERASNRLFALIEEGVQIVDQWLHLRHVASLDSALPPSMHRREPGAELRDSGKPATHLIRTAAQGTHRYDRDQNRMRAPDEMDRPSAAQNGHVRKMLEHLRDEDERQQHQSDRPQSGPEQDTYPERQHHWPNRYPKPRTVSTISAPSFRRTRATNTSTVFESRSMS